MKTYQVFFLSENFQFLEVKFSIYLNRRVFIIMSIVIVTHQLFQCLGKVVIRGSVLS